MFITTKFYPAHRDPVAEIEQSLQRLGVDHVDLYIIHWPQGGPTWAWPGMEQALQNGYARSIVRNRSICTTQFRGINRRTARSTAARVRTVGSSSSRCRRAGLPQPFRQSQAPLFIC